MSAVTAAILEFVATSPMLNSIRPTDFTYFLRAILNLTFFNFKDANDYGILRFLFFVHAVLTLHYLTNIDASFTVNVF